LSLRLPASSVSLLPLFLFLISLDALLDVLLKLPALARRQLVKFEFEDFSVALVNALSDDFYYASLLLWSEVPDTLLEQGLLVHRHLFVVNGLLCLLNHRVDLVLSPHILRCVLLLYLLHLLLEFLDLLRDLGLLSSRLAWCSWLWASCSWHWHGCRLRNQGFVVEICKELLEVLLDFLSLLILLRVTCIPLVRLCPHFPEIKAKLEGRLVLLLPEL
jgi:hypothetical protein